MRASGYFTPQPPCGGFGLKPLVRIFLVIIIIFSVTRTTILCQPVKIGLLVQDSSCKSAIRGAEIAVRSANEKGGMNGKPFRLVVRSMEGPWGTGSKQAVGLIFNEKVWALLGSHDGRNAHLVEQAATKSTVVFISAWSGDPTLSQAFVPWFFNCVPNYDRQAEALAGEIYEKRKYNSIAVISDNDYDSGLLLKALLQITTLKGMIPPEQFSCGNLKNNAGNLKEKVLNRGFDCLILFCDPLNTLAILRAVRKINPEIQLFGSLIILNEDILSEDEMNEVEKEIHIISTINPEHGETNFSRQYFKMYGVYPGLVSSFSFDMANVLINAILKAGSPDREKIQEALYKTNYNGITGLIRFDDKGKREGKAFIF